MWNLFQDLYGFLRTALVFLATFALSSILVFRFFYDGTNDDAVFIVQLIVVFLLNLFWNIWKAKRAGSS
ncbi:hypothetical protein T458_11130 [Brevibacillus panacihumi W25]|uniref:Uncharacterized protein n=1 Tax=Brevibacillus panacihumi W25 TaxID=1408254 RepID=V6M9C0_9BACL|nr:hypothetical protein [Brevibacillus panacihumi]EST55114.1 hypothetical protein T458_11130 [Brevibacillus panacihumi W25]